MKANNRSYRRHRNPENSQKKTKPFFSSPQQEQSHSGNAFFQPKLAMGEVGDKYEREADAVADKTVGRQSHNNIDATSGHQITAVTGMAQKKEETDVAQRKDAGAKEEDKPVQKTAASKEEDKPVQKTVASKEEDKPVQKMEAPKEDEKPVQKTAASKEEDKPVQKMEAPKEEEKPVQKMDAPKEEEKPVQKKEEHEKNPSTKEAVEDKKEKDGKPSVMAKAASGPSSQDTQNIAGKLEQLSNKGEPMPHQLNNEMSQSIGADFSGVNIHTGGESAELNQQLGAQAFTHGNNIYFNDGKFNPQTTAGKHLLAHELTHVVQQGAAPQVKSAIPSARTATASHVQRNMSTPLPAGVSVDKRSRVAKFNAGGFFISILPDRKARKSDKTVKPGGALTTGNIRAKYAYQKQKGKIVSVTVSKKLEIQTTYGTDAGSSMDSAYGRGALKSDKEAGHGSLGFHEGSHGTDFINYVKNNAYPDIQITDPITEKEFKELVTEWELQCRQYQSDMEATSKTQTDEVTDP